MFVFVNIFLLLLIISPIYTIHPLEQREYDNETKKSDIYLSEFEISEMINHDGRLQNGFCCNGLRPVAGQGCKEGNTTCLPFWKICIAELAPDLISVTNREDLHNTSGSYTTTTKKPSLIQNIFTKIFSGIAKLSHSDKNKHLKEIMEHMSPSMCHVGFWSSQVIMPDTIFPIKMRKLVSFKSSKMGTILNRNFVSIVEIWSKNVRNDIKNRLISRQINHYNVFVEIDTLSNEWFYGGKVIPSPVLYSTNEISNSKGSLIHKNMPQIAKRFSYRYRWHLKSLNKMREDGYSMEEVNLLNMTNEGCPQGYQGSDCNNPVCLEGCHQDHGYCEQPGQCSCRFGWTGMFCNYCLTLPGCVHGTCNRPFECRCVAGWTGMFCSIPECKDGCHHLNGYCTKPAECKCKFGWQGENCTECSTLPGCQHGTCNEPLDCNCEPGWQGTFCSTPICANGCQNGWCKKPDECRCKVGFKGENCTECVPYPGCKHGTCYENKPWTCQCEPGYGGFACDERLDWCERNVDSGSVNPCQNGSTCISVEQDNGSYFCKCSIGYTGKNCDQIV